jgi:hypothetical protein
MKNWQLLRTHPAAVQTLELLADALYMVSRTTKCNYRRLKARHRVPSRPKPGIG